VNILEAPKVHLSEVIGEPPHLPQHVGVMARRPRLLGRRGGCAESQLCVEGLRHEMQTVRLACKGGNNDWIPQIVPVLSPRGTAAGVV